MANDTLDIMLDLETMGNGNKPVLAQLAAVCFKLEQGIPLDSFNKLISPQSCVKVGLTCASTYGSDPTMDWWLKQDKDVFNKIIVEALLHGEELDQVLTQFSQWLKEMMKKHGCKYVRVYGKGPAADCVWLRSAYDSCDMKAPWMFWDDCCVRTYLDISFRAFGVKIKDMPFEGSKHDAIDDCKHQIKMVSAVFKLMKKSN